MVVLAARHRIARAGVIGHTNRRAIGREIVDESTPIVLALRDEGLGRSNDIERLTREREVIDVGAVFVADPNCSVAGIDHGFIIDPDVAVRSERQGRKTCRRRHDARRIEPRGLAVREQGRRTIAQRQLILIGRARSIKGLEAEVETLQPAAKIRGPLGIPAAIGQCIKSATISAVPGPLPAEGIERDSGTPSTESLAELIDRIRGDSSDADETFVHEDRPFERDLRRRRDLRWRRRRQRRAASQDHEDGEPRDSPPPAPTARAIGVDGKCLCPHFYAPALVPQCARSESARGSNPGRFRHREEHQSGVEAECLMQPWLDTGTRVHLPLTL